MSGVINEEKYITIQHFHKEKKWCIIKMCQQLNVSRAGYYKWLKREPSQKQLSDEDLSRKITYLYNKQNGILGYRQMTIAINRIYDLKCNEKRIHRIMKILGLKSVARKKRRYNNKKHQKNYTAENILNRDFKANKPCEKWLTDVTEFKYGENSKAYLSAVLDLYGRKIVGFSMSKRNDNLLVFDTFDKIFKKLPKAKPLIHSDRGYQYTSIDFRKRINERGMIQSMSRPGKCIDNGPMEGFWSFIKTEMYYLFNFDSFEKLKIAVKDYIYFYNNERFQKNLNSMTPVEFTSYVQKSR